MQAGGRRFEPDHLHHGWAAGLAAVVWRCGSAGVLGWRVVAKKQGIRCGGHLLEGRSRSCRVVPALWGGRGLLFGFVLWLLFFVRVNQVLVRLWARGVAIV